MEDTELSAAKTRFYLGEVAYGFVPSGTAARVAGPGPTRIWSRWQEWYATSGCAKASLCPLKHRTTAVGWHSLPGSRVGPFSATARLGCARRNTAHFLDLQSNIRSYSRQSWAPTAVTHRGKKGRAGAKPRPAQPAPPPRRMLVREAELPGHVHIRPDSQQGIRARGTHGCFPNARVQDKEELLLDRHRHGHGDPSTIFNNAGFTEHK